MPYNIPSNDPGVVLVPGNIETFCEWLVRLAGQIATCVESSEMMVNHLVKSGFPCNAAEDTALAQDLINRGEASPNGATNYVAASQQMARLGIPNTTYDAGWFRANDFVPVVQGAIRRGIPVLYGTSEAHYAHDDWTNSAEDAGVYGHGICLVGFDATGAIAADPNTSQAENGQFVHYTWANLKAMGGLWPSMVIPNGSMRLDISQVGEFFTAQADGSWKCKQTGVDLSGDLLSVYCTYPSTGTLAGLTELGLPISGPHYLDQAKYPGAVYVAFERGVLMYDPTYKFDRPVGVTAAVYKAHVDTTTFYANQQGGGSDTALVAQLKAEVAALQTQVAQLQKTQVPADLHSALAAAAQLLSPAVQAAAGVTQVMKELGY